MSIVTRLYRGETRIDFIGSPQALVLRVGVLLLICILSFIFRGFNYGVEFEGGTQFQLKATGTSISADDVEHGLHRRRHVAGRAAAGGRLRCHAPDRRQDRGP